MKVIFFLLLKTSFKAKKIVFLKVYIVVVDISDIFTVLQFTKKGQKNFKNPQNVQL